MRNHGALACLQNGVSQTIQTVKLAGATCKARPLSDEDLEACVSESLAQGWVGLFPEKFTSPCLTDPSPRHPKFSQKKEGGAPPVIPIKPADFPWRELALNVRGEELVGTWEDQDGRTRRELRQLWSELPAATKAAQWELAKGGDE